MDNLNIGITLMVIGMSAVFVFLSLMIVVVDITAKIIGYINKYFPETIPEEKNIPTKKDNDAEVALAIAVALRERSKV